MAQQITRGYKALVAEAEQAVRTVSPAEALAMAGKGAVLVDLRDPRELEREGTVAGAFHCPRGMLEFWIDPDSPYHKPVFQQDGPFVFFCAGGWRSALAARAAQDMGLAPVAHVAGGFSAWKQQGVAYVAPKAGPAAQDAEVVARTRALLDRILAWFNDGDFQSMADHVAFPLLTSDARASYALTTPDAFIAHMDVVHSYFMDSGQQDFTFQLVDIRPLSEVFTRAFVQLVPQSEPHAPPVEPIELGLVFRNTGAGLKLCGLADHQPEVTGFAFAVEGPSDEPEQNGFMLVPGGKAHDDLLSCIRARMARQYDWLNAGHYDDLVQAMSFPCHVITSRAAGVLLDAATAVQSIRAAVDEAKKLGIVRLSMAECELVGASRVFAFVRVVHQGENAMGQVVGRATVMLHLRLNDDTLNVVGFATLDSERMRLEAADMPD